MASARRCASHCSPPEPRARLSRARPRHGRADDRTDIGPDDQTSPPPGKPLTPPSHTRRPTPGIGLRQPGGILGGVEPVQVLAQARRPGRGHGRGSPARAFARVLRRRIARAASLSVTVGSMVSTSPPLMKSRRVTAIRGILLGFARPQTHLEQRDRRQARRRSASACRASAAGHPARDGRWRTASCRTGRPAPAGSSPGRCGCLRPSGRPRRTAARGRARAPPRACGCPRACARATGP